MIDLARKLDKADREALSRAAMHLTKMEQYPFAAEVYSKMGDIRALINLHVEAKHWEDVRSLFHLLNCFVNFFVIGIKPLEFEIRNLISK